MFRAVVRLNLLYNKTELKRNNKTEMRWNKKVVSMSSADMKLLLFVILLKLERPVAQQQAKSARVMLRQSFFTFNFF